MTTKQNLASDLSWRLAPRSKNTEAVSVEDRLDADALPVVLWVFLVFVDRAQAPGSYAATDCFLEGIVIGFVGHGGLLVGAVQAIADLGQLVIRCSILGHIIDRDAVIPVLVDNPNDGQHDFVDLKLGFVLILV